MSLFFKKDNQYCCDQILFGEIFQRRNVDQRSTITTLPQSQFLMYFGISMTIPRGPPSMYGLINGVMVSYVCPSANIMRAQEGKSFVNHY